MDLCEQSRWETGGEGFLIVVGKGRPRIGGGEEKDGSGSRELGRRVVDRRGGGNAPIMTTGRDRGRGDKLAN